jgi:hypothetical protein
MVDLSIVLWDSLPEGKMPRNHELYLISVFANGTENPAGDRLTITFTADPDVSQWSFSL